MTRAFALALCLAACTSAPGVTVRAEGSNDVLSAVTARDDATCPNGGARVESGVDRDGDRTLDPDEVVLRVDTCNGTTAIVRETADATQCPNGGRRVDAGIDANGNDVLDDAEITSTAAVCDGADGADGSDGLNGSDGQPGPRGVTGASGVAGQNGVTGSSGRPGPTGSTGLVSLAATVSVGAGPGCAKGGTRLDVGRDDDRDGTLDAGEVDLSQVFCVETPRPGFVYSVVTQTGDGPRGARLDPTDGAITTEIATLGNYASHAFKSVAATRDVVFLASDAAPNQLRALRVQRPSGDLVELAASPFPSPPLRKVITDRDGRFLFGASPSANVVQSFAIDQLTGALGPTSSVTLTPHRALGYSDAWHRLFAASGNTLHVIDVETNGVLTLQGTTGALTGPGSADVSGISVVDFATKTYVYVSDRARDAIHAFAYDGATLTPTQAPVQLTNIDPGASAIDPAGQHLYVALEFQSGIGGAVATYAIDATDGTLVVNGATAASCARPSGIAVDPSYESVYVACVIGATISRLPITSNGQPGALSSLIAQDGLQDLVVVPQ